MEEVQLYKRKMFHIIDPQASILAEKFELPEPKLTEFEAKELISVEKFVQTFPNFCTDPFIAPIFSD